MKSVFQQIFSGYSFRSKIETMEGGDLHVIQMKDLLGGYTEIGKDLSKIRAASINEKYHLHKNDILFLAKGAHNYACVYDGAFDKAVAASAFFVLRPDIEIIYPKYLAWYINQEPIQKYLQENKTGTYTLNVNRSVIENMPLEYPSLVIQRSIVQIANLQKEEHKLIESIGQKRKRLVSSQLLTTMKESI